MSRDNYGNHSRGNFRGRNENRSYRGRGNRNSSDYRAYPTNHVDYSQQMQMNQWGYPAVNMNPNLNSMSEQQVQALLYQQEYERQCLMHQLAMCEMMASQESNPYLNPMFQPPMPDMQQSNAGYYGMPQPPMQPTNFTQAEDEEDISQYLEQFDREVKATIEKEYEKKCDFGNDIDSDPGQDLPGEAEVAEGLPDDEEYLQFIMKDQEASKSQNATGPTTTEAVQPDPPASTEGNSTEGNPTTNNMKEKAKSESSE